MKEQKDKITEKEWYRRKIVEMVEGIDTEKFIKMIYAFTKALWNEEKEE